MAGRGFRIRHKTERAVEGISPLVTVAILSLPLNPPHDCPVCGADVFHHVKTVHLQLDALGYCLVSNGVLEQLGQAGAIQLDTAGFIAGADPVFDYVGDMDDPPPLQLNLAEKTIFPVPATQIVHVDYDN